MAQALDFLHNCRVEVWPARYAVVKASRIPDTFVSVFRDQSELTVVAEEKELSNDWAVAVERGWRILSFRVTLPFELTGFLAEVARALAEAGVAIYALSAYSTDHILVKQDDLPPAIGALRALGCTVKEPS